MLIHKTAKLLLAATTFLTVVTLFHMSLRAEAIDTLYIQKNGVNIRTAPGTSSPVLMKLNMGHELLEIFRQGNWVNVGIARTGGKDGWVHASLVGPTSPGGTTVAPPDPRFDAFVRDLNRLNAKVKNALGYNFFTKVENMGDGIVQLTGTNPWLSSPRPDHERTLTTVFNLWSTHEGTGRPIFVHIVDRRGTIVMSRSRPR